MPTESIGAPRLLCGDVELGQLPAASGIRALAVLAKVLEAFEPAAR